MVFLFGLCFIIRKVTISAVKVIFSSRLELMNEKISRLFVSEDKMTHFDEQSGKPFSQLEGRIWTEGRFIALGKLIPQ